MSCMYFQAVHYRIPSGNPDRMPHSPGTLLNYHSSAGVQVALRPLKAFIRVANKFIVSNVHQ